MLLGWRLVWRACQWVGGLWLLLPLLLQLLQQVEGDWELAVLLRALLLLLLGQPRMRQVVQLHRPRSGLLLVRMVLLVLVLVLLLLLQLRLLLALERLQQLRLLLLQQGVELLLVQPSRGGRP